MVPPAVLIVMGVSGVGKTTVGQALAAHLGWAFADADDLHPAANAAKMQRGEGLTDADRAPWLLDLRAVIERHLAAASPLVLACSALAARYRDVLRVDDRVRFIWLHVPRDVLEKRLLARTGHFAGPSLLPSQFASLEPPSEQDAVPIDATAIVGEVVRRVIAALGTDLRENPG